VSHTLVAVPTIVTRFCVCVCVCACARPHVRVHTVSPCLPWQSLLPGCVFSAYDMLMPKKRLSIGIMFSDLHPKAKKEQYNILHVTQHIKSR